jgi:hypothetical protein
VGKVRENLGGASNDYGASFARGFWRHGYSDTLTLEGIGQATSRQKTIELGMQFPVLGEWLGSAALTASHFSSLGMVQQWLLGVERQGLHSSIFLQAKGASKTSRPEPGRHPRQAAVDRQLELWQRQMGHLRDRLCFDDPLQRRQHRAGPS